MLFRCEVVNYHTGIVVPFNRDWISLVLDWYCTTTTRWIHTHTKTTSKRCFPGAYESHVTAYGTKKKQVITFWEECDDSSTTLPGQCRRWCTHSAAVPRSDVV